MINAQYCVDQDAGFLQVLASFESKSLSAVCVFVWIMQLVIEGILKDVHVADPNWRIVLLRFFNPVGSHPSGDIGEDPRGVPNNLMPVVQQVAVGRRTELTVFGNDYNTRDGTGVSLLLNPPLELLSSWTFWRSCVLFWDLLRCMSAQFFLSTSLDYSAKNDFQRERETLNLCVLRFFFFRCVTIFMSWIWQLVIFKLFISYSILLT
jgi:hypothetical protein